MGYCMGTEDVKFYIDRKHFAACMEALRATVKATDKMGGFGSSGGKTTRHFAWVDMSFPDKKTLPLMLERWRWSLELDDSGNAIGICFKGEKLGDDEFLFQTLAPFVKRGSYIDMRGEDGALWRWKFDGKTMKEQTGKVTFR